MPAPMLLSETIGDVDPVAVVDDALRAAAGAGLVTAVEATEILERVGSGTEAAPQWAEIHTIVTVAVASYADQPVLDRGRLLDTLLDIRSTLARSDDVRVR